MQSRQDCRVLFFALAEAQTGLPPPDAAISVTQATRSVLWLNYDYIVVYDPAPSPNAGLFRRFNLSLAAPRFDVEFSAPMHKSNGPPLAAAQQALDARA